ncbi:MAG: HDOD domain-containing protein [Deltaproteobacteria bacterium]|nr:HDOD domain-containing protein [Deltaproteobacteria bacterium]
MDVYVARQPIFDKNKKVHGYELLFRDGLSNAFPDIDGNTATSKVLHHSFLTIGLDNITGSGSAFVNFTQDLLLRRVPLLFPSHRMVVEVLEDVEPVDGVIQACREIRQGGYALALDDFFYSAGMEPLIALADIVKMDFRATPPDEMGAFVEPLSGRSVNLLAEKVETHEEFARALDMGFRYFQGYFFSKPEVLQGRDISNAHMGLLEIMAEANKEGFEIDHLEKLIARDVTVSYKLMRYINSAYFKRVNEISSIRQAIVLLGEKQIRRFLSLIAMANLAEGKPNELIRTSIIRAKFCEALGEMNHQSVNPSELFTLGLFSCIDAIMDGSMEDLMEKLPLSRGIKEALVKGAGSLSGYLAIVLDYEKGRWKQLADSVEQLGLSEEEIPDRYVETLAWAEQFMHL